MATASKLQRLSSDTISLQSGYAALLAELREALPAHPDVAVHYHDLKYTVKVPSVAYDVPTVASACVGCLAGMARGLACRAEEGTPLHVLQGIDGTLRPGTMTLVLAPPGHGKSAFLQALGGRISGEGVTGKVTYGGLTADEVPGSLNKLVAYMPQHDEHMALLTVRETLNFALKNAVVANEGLLQDAGAVKAMVRRVDTVLKLLGLEECAETYVGNDLVRGVSGGQRKRISIGEVLITNARVMLLDEYSTGLDTSTTFDITNALRQWTRHMGGVLGASLLQPTPEVYALFDDIVLLREGAVVFHGPRHLLRPFFEAAGWVIPPTVDEADWLVEMLTDPPAMWAKAQQPGVTPSAGPGAPPLTTADMVTAWRASDLCSRLSAAARGQDVPPGPPGPPSEASDAEEGAGSAEESSGAASQEDGAGSEESADAQAHTKSDWLAGYSAPALALQSAFANQQFGTGATQSWGAHFALNLSRQWSLLTRNPMYMAGKLMDNCLMGAALGSLFWQLPQESAVGRLGAVVFGLVLAAFSNFAVIPSAIEARNVIQKQDRLGFYPMSSYVAATAVMHLPVAALESMALSALIYFMPGFVNDAGRFLFFYLFIFMTDMLFAMVFQVLTYVSPNMEAAQSLSAPLVSLFLLFAGLLNTRSSIPDFMIWMYWLSPFAWSTRAVAQNEFLSSEYDAAVPGTDKNFGQVLLERFEVQTEEDYQWAGVVFNLAMYVLAFGLTVFAISKVRFDVAIGTARPTKADEEAAPQAVPEVRPVPPKTLTFADLGYTVKLKDGTERALLTNVNGVMRPGTCTALCGVSGAGKSTLLDVLAGRKTAGKQTGQVFVNGQVQDPLTFARITAYVEQESLLMDHATVLESVQFAAALRLDPEAVDAATRETIVTEVMTIMELNPLADRIVGEAGTRNALSPSQRKLLSIAIELVSQPSILFLDEPTSGLDSRAAANVMRVVRNIANTGRTVICTIHQPSKEVFLSSFDAMLLLQRGGHTAFCGDLGVDADNMLQYFGTFPGVQPMREGDNPATWMLDVLDGGSGTLSAEAGDEEAVKAGGEQGVTDFPAAFEQSELAASVKTAVQEEKTRSQGSTQAAPPAQYATGVATQLWHVMGRHWLGYWRNTNLNFTRLSILTFLGFFFGLSYLDTPGNTVGGITSQISLLFIATSFAALMNQGVMLPVLAKERAVFYRERSANMYTPEVYGIAVVVCEVPYLVVISTVMATIYYWMAGFEADAGVFGAYLLMHALVSFAYCTLGMFFAIAMGDVESGQTTASLITTLWLLLGGTFAPWPTVPEGWAWTRWINPSAYAVNSMAAMQFHCDAEPTLAADGSVVDFNCPTLNLVTAAGSVDIPVWEYVKSTYDIRYEDRWTDMGWVVVIGAFWIVLFMLALRFISHLKR